MAQLDYRAEVAVDPACFPADRMSSVDHCTRHGRRAVRRIDMVVQSRVRRESPWWRRGELFTLLNDLVHWSKLVNLVYVYGWPLCTRCVLRRRVRLSLAWAVFGGSLLSLAFAGTFRMVTGEPFRSLPMAMVTFVGLLLSGFIFVWASRVRLIRVRASDDGENVVVRKPSSEFLSDVERASTVSRPMSAWANAHSIQGGQGDARTTQQRANE